MSFISTRRHRLKPALLACVAGLSFMASPAFAQQVDSTKLLELMVAKGLVSRSEADALISQATVAPAPVQQAQAPVPPGGVSGDVQTIPYVPQVVRDQIVEQVRAELGTQAATEGWARPGEVAEWTKRITLYGDVRVRGDATFMDKNNADIFEDFGSINAGAGQNINTKTPGYIGPQYLNTLENRQRMPLRARLGVRAQIDDWISADIRIATGSDNSPVTTNQTLGGNANLGKYSLWLDRASIRLTPMQGVNVDFGRFANPFWTSDLLFDEDLNFDGAALSVSTAVNDDLTLFGTFAGAPVFNTDFNFGSRNAPIGQGGPFESKDKYLAAAQFGVDYRATEQVRLRLAAGYFHFSGVEGEVSSPCQFYETVCDTDPTRPQFQQFGNTMFPIRDIITDPLDPVGSPENQYFGLASKFEILNIHGSVDFTPSETFGVRLEGDFVKNLGFDRNVLTARAVNNLGPSTEIPDPNDSTKTLTIPGAYDGGDMGWSARLTVGRPDLAKFGDWNVHVGYRYLESDAVVDAFTDSDFGLGGTNSKGFILGGNYAFGKNTSIGMRWFSADEIADAPLSVDRLFIDLNTRF